MKMISFAVAVVLVLNAYGLAYPAEPPQDALGAQTGTQAERIRMDIQKRGVGEKSRVKIRLGDKTEVKGYISQIDVTSFQVTDKKTGRVSTIHYGTVDTVSGGGLSRGSKIAIGVGVGVAACFTVFALIVASWHGN
jgi:hypothetical protein